jgi:hypothetical protein
MFHCVYIVADIRFIVWSSRLVSPRPAYRQDSDATTTAPSGRSSSVIQPRRNMLTKFLELASPTDDQLQRIVRFARRWGPLGLCRAHGEPYTHASNRVCYPDFIGRRSKRRHGINAVLGDTPKVFREPLSKWVQFAAQARATLNVCAQVSNGREPRQEDLATLGLDALHGPSRRYGAVGAELLNRWLDRCRVQPLCSFAPKINQFSLELTAWPALFGSLGVQMVFAASRIDCFAVCTACGCPYIPRRRPNPNRFNYCEGCRDRARWRNAYHNSQRRRRTNINL